MAFVGVVKYTLSDPVKSTVLLYFIPPYSVEDRVHKLEDFEKAKNLMLLVFSNDNVFSS